MNIQAVCDSKGIFIDVDCRWPGSVHDAKVFAKPSISGKLKGGKLPSCCFVLVAVLARTLLKMRMRKLNSQPGLGEFAII